MIQWVSDPFLKFVWTFDRGYRPGIEANRQAAGAAGAGGAFAAFLADLTQPAQAARPL